MERCHQAPAGRRQHPKDVKVRGRPQPRSLGNHVHATHRPGSRSIPPQSRLLSTSRLRFLRSPRHRLSYRVCRIRLQSGQLLHGQSAGRQLHRSRSHRCFLHQHRPSRGGTARREAGQCPFLRGGSHRCRSIRHLALESQTVPATASNPRTAGTPEHDRIFRLRSYRRFRERNRSLAAQRSPHLLPRRAETLEVASLGNANGESPSPRGQDVERSDDPPPGRFL